MTKQNRKSFNIAITAQKAAIKRNKKTLKEQKEKKHRYLHQDFESQSKLYQKIAKLEVEIEFSDKPMPTHQKRLDELIAQRDEFEGYCLIAAHDRISRLEQLIKEQIKELRFLESLPLDLEKHRFRGWLA